MSKLTKIERLKDSSGTYEITYVESKRRKLTTEDELIPIIAGLADTAQRAVKDNEHLLIGEKDVFLAFARRFIGYLKDDPKLFDDFLNEIRDWPRDKKS